MLSRKRDTQRHGSSRYLNLSSVVVPRCLRQLPYVGCNISQTTRQQHKQPESCAAALHVGSVCRLTSVALHVSMAARRGEGGRGESPVPGAGSTLWMVAQAARERAPPQLEQKMGARKLLCPTCRVKWTLHVECCTACSFTCWMTVCAILMSLARWRMCAISLWTAFQ